MSDEEDVGVGYTVTEYEAMQQRAETAEARVRLLQHELTISSKATQNQRNKRKDTRRWLDTTRAALTASQARLAELERVSKLMEQTIIDQGKTLTGHERMNAILRERVEKLEGALRECIDEPACPMEPSAYETARALLAAPASAEPEMYVVNPLEEAARQSRKHLDILFRAPAAAAPKESDDA